MNDYMSGINLFNIYLTNSCQRNCSFCYNKKDKQYSLDINVLKKFYEWFSEHSKASISVRLSGGDPLLYDHIDNVLEYFRGKIIGVAGNPHTINDKNIKILKDNGVKRFALSLDGPLQLHDHNRGKGDFLLTMEKVKLLNENGFRVILSHIISKKSIDYLEETMDIASKASPVIFNPGLLIPMDGNTENIITLNQHQDLFMRIWKKYCLIKKDIPDFQIRLRCEYWKPFFEALGVPFEISSNILMGCRIYKNWIIKENGDLQICSKLPIPFFNIYSDKWDKDLLNQRVSMLLDRSKYECFLLKKCRFSEDCFGCPAFSFMIKGNMFLKDPLCPL